MATNEHPYPECQNCQDLSDCKHTEVNLNEMGLSLPLPPDNCPFPIDVMKKTHKKHRKYEGN